MTTIELKQHLLEEHKRDKKLSILGVLLILITAIVIITLIYFFAYDIAAKMIKSFMEQLTFLTNSENSGETPFYYKLAIPFAVMSMILPVVYKVITLSKRPKKIDEFIGKIDSGLIASSVDQLTVYKIIIPLIKIKLKLAPVEYVNILLDGDTSYKPYLLPINVNVIPDLKKVLSGVNLQNIDKAWYDLYGEFKKEGNEKEYELKPKEAFQEFIKTDLIKDLDKVENERSEGKSRYIKYMIFTVIFCAIFYGGMYYIQSSPDIEFKQSYLLYGFGVLTGILYLFMFVNNYLKKKAPVVVNSLNSFKMKILKPMVAFVNPNFQFILHGHITLPELLETGLLENRNYKLEGNDQIIGSHRGVPFQLSDLSVEYKRNFSSENDGPDFVFYGQVFIAKFNKSFNSELYLVPKIKRTAKEKVKGVVSGLVPLTNMTGKATDIDLYTSNDFGSKVELEDPEFSKLFDVYCNDQIEARYILTPALMERIKTLSIRTKGNFFISFRNDRVSVLNNNGRNNFEAGLFKSLTKNENKMLTDFYTDLCDQLLIIDDLKLNVNIWNKK